MLDFKKHIQVTLEDYVAFDKNRRQKRFSAKKTILTLVWCMLGFAFLFTFLTYTIGIKYGKPLEDDSTSFHIILIIIMFLFFALVFFTAVASIWLLNFAFNYFNRRWKYRSEVRFKDFEILINDLGIQCSGAFDNFSIPWYQVVDVVETRDAFYFYYAPKEAFILPKRYTGMLAELCELSDGIKEIRISHIASNYN